MCCKGSRICMNYDKATVKEFILNYHKTIDNSETRDENVDIDDFFNVCDQPVNNVIGNNNFEDAIFFNELKTIIERVGTDREFYLFLLLCKGISYEKIGSIFDVQAQRVRQMFNALLDKISG